MIHHLSGKTPRPVTSVHHLYLQLAVSLCVVALGIFELFLSGLLDPSSPVPILDSSHLMGLLVFTFGITFLIASIYSWGRPHG